LSLARSRDGCHPDGVTLHIAELATGNDPQEPRLTQDQGAQPPQRFDYRSMHHDGPRQERFPSLVEALAKALTDRRNWIAWPIDITYNGRVIVDEPALSRAYTEWNVVSEPVEACAARLARDLRLALEQVTPDAVREQIAMLPARDRDAGHAGADLIWKHVLAAIAQGRCTDAAACAAAALETLNLGVTR